MEMASQETAAQPTKGLADEEDANKEGTTVPEGPIALKKVQKGPSRRCRHWARGLCKLGASCTFLHSGVAGVHVPCRHFVRTGSCSRGDLCDFKHEGNFGYGVGLYATPPRMAASTGVVPPFALAYAGQMGGILHNGDYGPAMYAQAQSQAQAQMLQQQSALQHRLSAQAAANMSMANLNAASMHAVASMNAAANFGNATLTAAANLAALSIHLPQLPAPVNVGTDGLIVTTPTAAASTSRCRHWENGSCRLAKSCGFLHDPTVPQKFRTKVCRHWEKGSCKLGEACSFAHAISVAE